MFSAISFVYTKRMSGGTSRFVSRLLFLVMAMTFLSPALGAQMTVDHEQLHALAKHADESSMAHEHDADDDEDAHALIGHLFLHMPHFVSSASQLLPTQFVTGADLPVLRFPPSCGIPELPFKPPRVLLFV